jgi:hypothetical protein
MSDGSGMNIDAIRSRVYSKRGREEHDRIFRKEGHRECERREPEHNTMAEGAAGDE